MTAVSVWWASVEHTVRPPGLARLLNEDEQARHRAYHRPADAERFLLGVALTRIAAGRELGLQPDQVPLDRRCPGCGKPHGKVRVAGDSDLELSVTHSGDLVGVALTHAAALGLDVEHLTDRLNQAELTSHVLSPSEAAAFAGVPATDQPAAFLRYWVRKEAIVKSTGDGIGVGLGNLTVSSPDSAPALLTWPARPDLPGRLALFDLSPAPRHPAALAVITDQPATVTVSAQPATALLA
jgi:4'-phosphopantetheinyl transferase